MKLFGVGRWRSMLGRVFRRGGFCRVGGFSFGSVVGVVRGWVGRGVV